MNDMGDQVDPEADVQRSPPNEERWKSGTTPAPLDQRLLPKQAFEEGDTVKHVKNLPDGRTQSTTCIVEHAKYETQKSGAGKWKYRLKVKATRNDYEDGAYTPEDKLRG